MFSNQDDDDLFNPTSTSHLASLFGTSMTLQRDSDTSLVYTAPKQPKPGGQETPKLPSKPTTPQNSVISTKFVEAYKLLDKNYTSIGKCGIAIIGNESVKTYDLILYRTKQDILSRSRLRLDIIFIVQANDFVSFCDDQRMQWTVHFDDAKSLEEFTEQIKNHNGMVTVSDTVKQANVCDKTSSSTNKIKSEPIDSPSSLSMAKRDSDSSDSNTQTRANILSRMAKMGQPILPVNLPNTSEQSDSETDEQTVNKKPVKKKQKFVLVNGEYVSSDKIKTVNSSQSLNLQTTPEFLMLNGQIVPVSSLKQNLPAQVQPALSNQYITSLPNQVMLNTQATSISDSLHVFIAENRTHNCELRMNMNQLSSKLDNILSKFNKDNHTIPDGMPNKNELELRILEKTKAIEENEELIRNLQKQVQKLQEDTKDNELTITNLSKQNQDQKHFIADLECKVNELNRDKDDLKQEIMQSKIQNDDLHSSQQTIEELKHTVEEQKIKIQDLEKSSLENKQEDLESQLDVLNKEVIDLKAQLDDKNLKADLFAKKLKQSMNTLYQQVMENFEDEGAAFQSIQIKQILSQKLKTATLQIIQDFQNDFKSSD